MHLLFFSGVKYTEMGSAKWGCSSECDWISAKRQWLVRMRSISRIAWLSMLWEVLHSYFWDWMWFNIYNLLFIGIVNIPTYSAWMLIKWGSVSAKCPPLFLVSCCLTQWAISSHLKLAVSKRNYQWKHPLITQVPFLSL